MTTKDRIIQSAVELFSEKGYTETGLRSIAESVGIQSGSIYNHFLSKEELLNYILDLYHQKMHERVVSREEVDEMVKTLDAKTILGSAVFYLEEEEQAFYSKILKIILQEQYRNKKAGNFVKHVLYDEVEDYLSYVLGKLSEAKKIKPIDPTLYARMINAINMSAIIEFAHYAPKDFFERTAVTRLDLTNHILGTITI